MKNDLEQMQRWQKTLWSGFLSLPLAMEERPFGSIHMRRIMQEMVEKEAKKKKGKRENGEESKRPKESSVGLAT